MPDEIDLADANRRLRGLVKRLEEDLAVLMERYAFAQQQIRELSARVQAKEQLRVGIRSVNDGGGAAAP